MTDPELSVVIPVYGNAGTLKPLLEEIRVALDGRPGGYEVLFVDDASPDGSLDAIRFLENADGRVRVISLARNVGQSRALLAGIRRARGRAVVSMDADLQDDPAVAAALVDELGDEAMVVFSGRRGAYQSRLRLAQSRVFKRLLWAVSGGRLPADAGLCFAMNRAAKDRIERSRGQYLLSRMARSEIAMRSVPARRRSRGSGTSRYTEKMRWGVALRALWEALAPDGWLKPEIEVECESSERVADRPA